MIDSTKGFYAGYPNRSLIEESMKAQSAEKQKQASKVTHTPKTSRDDLDDSDESYGYSSEARSIQPSYRTRSSYDAQVGSRSYLRDVPTCTNNLGGKKE